jgi:acetyl esterase/lipase
MTDPRDDRVPQPLRDWLLTVREAKEKAREHGYRRTATNTREAWDTLTRRFAGDPPEIAWVRDELIPGPDYRVPVRVYHPSPERPLPVALFVHGGGHIAGGVSTYDPIARRLALAADRVVVSIEYRLAPECPYPAALKDAMACAKRVFRLLENLAMPFEPRLALMGDSGGGALCATVSHRAQYEAGLCIERQVLIYPSLDYTLSQPSVTENGEGYLLERERILWMFDAYLQNAEDRRALSPLFMDLTPDYPATLVITGEFDPLRDEGVAYAERLRSHGIDADHRVLSGMVHGFLNLESMVPDACGEVYAAIGDFLKR